MDLWISVLEARPFFVSSNPIMGDKAIVIPLVFCKRAPRIAVTIAVIEPGVNPIDKEVVVLISEIQMIDPSKTSHE